MRLGRLGPPPAPLQSEQMEGMSGEPFHSSRLSAHDPILPHVRRLLGSRPERLSTRRRTGVKHVGEGHCAHTR
jgi:hypothetical protein